MTLLILLALAISMLISSIAGLVIVGALYLYRRRALSYVRVSSDGVYVKDPQTGRIVRLAVDENGNFFVPTHKLTKASRKKLRRERLRALEANR
jgi:hypothetical protein